MRTKYLTYAANTKYNIASDHLISNNNKKSKKEKK